ncbi:hypothetical protein ASF61_04815 [Duganella sp. Leaf126]|nr:hypothetical protein ASF61_04815 [Duganella sp. Leaf126]
MTRLRDAGVTGFPLSLQVGFRSLSEDRFIPALCDRLAQQGLPASMLQIEIDERTLQRDPQLMRKITQQLRACDIGLALGDVGDGATLLSSLPELGASHLKVCAGAVGAISPEGDEGALARLLIDLGHTLGMTVVADGVETAAQAEFLRQHGCDLLQGSHIGHPVSASKLLTLLAPAGQRGSGAP